MNQQLKDEREEMRLNAVKVQSQRDEAWSRIAELKQVVGEQKHENRSLRDSYEHYQQKTAENRQQERDESRLVAQQHQRQIQQLLEQASKTETRYTSLLAEYKARGEALDALRAESNALQAHHTRTKADMD